MDSIGAISLPLDLPIVNTAADMEKNLKSIAGEKYSSKFTLWFTYSGHTNEVIFEKQEEGIYMLWIGGDKGCAGCSILPEGAHVEWINQKGCSVPETRKGTFVVEFVVVLLCSLGMKVIVLDDDARIFDGVLLLFVRIFQGKFSSWYESFSFQPDISSENFIKAAKQLHSHRLASGDTVGTTMVKLLEFDRNIYISVFDLLRKDPITGGLIKQIEDYNHKVNYVKKCRSQ